jgi:hypothetical protein
VERKDNERRRKRKIKTEINGERRNRTEMGNGIQAAAVLSSRCIPAASAVSDIAAPNSYKLQEPSHQLTQWWI